MKRFINEKTANEKQYQRTGDLFVLRTSSGRLVSSARHIEHIEYMLTGSRTLWKRVQDFGTVRWLARTA